MLNRRVNKNSSEGSNPSLSAINTIMEPITLIDYAGRWFDNKFVTTFYEQRRYEKGSSVTKVYEHITAEVYDRHGKIQVSPTVGTKVDTQA